MKVYMPKDMEQYLTCKMLKSIIGSGEEYFSYTGDCLYLVHKNEEQYFHNRIYNCSEDMNLEIKGYFKILDSKIFDGDEYQKDEEANILYEVTTENVDMIKDLYVNDKIEYKYYLNEVIKYDLYIKKFYLINNKTNEVIYESNEEDEIKLIHGIEPIYNIEEISFLSVKDRIIDVAHELIDADYKRICYSLDIMDNQYIQYAAKHPCNVCVDKCWERECGKPTTPVLDINTITVANIDRDLVLKYLERIKEEIEELKDSIVSKRRDKKRINYMALSWLSFDKKFLSSDIYVLTAYFKAMKELGSRPNKNLITEATESENKYNNRSNYSSVRELKEYVSTLGIDLYDFLEMPEKVRYWIEG